MTRSSGAGAFHFLYSENIAPRRNRWRRFRTTFYLWRATWNTVQYSRMNTWKATFEHSKATHDQMFKNYSKTRKWHEMFWRKLGYWRNSYACRSVTVEKPFIGRCTEGFSFKVLIVLYITSHGWTRFEWFWNLVQNFAVDNRNVLLNIFCLALHGSKLWIRHNKTDCVFIKVTLSTRVVFNEKMYSYHPVPAFLLRAPDTIMKSASFEWSLCTYQIYLQTMHFSKCNLCACRLVMHEDYLGILA